MEAVIRLGALNAEEFSDIAEEIGFDAFVATKLLYVMHDSDLDMFQLMNKQRITLLIYGFDVCQRHMLRAGENMPATTSHALQIMLKRLTSYTLDLWFSKEWEGCKEDEKKVLLDIMNSFKTAFTLIPELSSFNWDYMFQLGAEPWNLPYLQRFNIPKMTKNTTRRGIENFEEKPSAEDIAHLGSEDLMVTLIRLIKKFDTGAMESVKKLAMRVIVAWNGAYEKQAPGVALSDCHKRSLIFICHVYLMAVYETDTVRGFVIDNMMNNIRFYHQCIRTRMQEADYEDFQITPASSIALTCVYLGYDAKKFFELFVLDNFEDNFTSLFGVIAQAYKSYVLGNLLMELNSMNEQEFAANLDKFKRFLNMYVLERERSECFLLNEIKKQERQRMSHNKNYTVKNMTDFKSKICKGNRMSNTGSLGSATAGAVQKEKESTEKKWEGEKRIDTVFQDIPTNEEVLKYAYEVLAKREYDGWQFAKLVVLLKLIGLELNAIETWRYHPGLTTDFMMKLDRQLARHFVDLADIFQDHTFMEQEFRLTAFYLDPTADNYKAVVRSGMRYNRQRNVASTSSDASAPATGIAVDLSDDIELPSASKSKRKDRRGIPVPPVAKYELLSSTIDVHEIVDLTNCENPQADYEPLHKALRTLRLPDNMIKDLLAVTFMPRNKSFAWAVEWVELRKRCKMLVDNPVRKRKFVELNMAEANDRLKYLKIDYDKYRNRPQLDYGTIESGYENEATYTNLASDSEDEDDDDEDDFVQATVTPRKEVDKTKMVDYNPTDLAELLPDTSMRVTRARKAAVIASREQQQLSEEQLTDVTQSKVVSESCHEEQSKPSPAPDAALNNEFDNLLNVRPKYSNSTPGFKSFPDIWSFEEQDLKKLKNACMFSHHTWRSLSIVCDLVISRRAQRSESLSSGDNNDVTDEGVDTSCAKSTEVSDEELEDIPTDEYDSGDDYTSCSDVSTTAVRDSGEMSESAEESKDKEVQKSSKLPQWAQNEIAITAVMNSGEIFESLAGESKKPPESLKSPELPQCSNYANSSRNTVDAADPEEDEVPIAWPDLPRKVYTNRKIAQRQIDCHAPPQTDTVEAVNKVEYSVERTDNSLMDWQKISLAGESTKEEVTEVVKAPIAVDIDSLSSSETRSTFETFIDSAKKEQQAVGAEDQPSKGTETLLEADDEMFAFEPLAKKLDREGAIELISHDWSQYLQDKTSTNEAHTEEFEASINEEPQSVHQSKAEREPIEMDGQEDGKMHTVCEKPQDVHVEISSENNLSIQFDETIEKPQERIDSDITETLNEGPKRLHIEASSEQTSSKQMDGAPCKLEARFVSVGPKDLTECLGQEPTFLHVDTSSEQSSIVVQRDKTDDVHYKLKDSTEALGKMPNDLYVDTSGEQSNAHLRKTPRSLCNLKINESAAASECNTFNALTEELKDEQVEAYSDQPPNTQIKELFGRPCELNVEASPNESGRDRVDAFSEEPVLGVDTLLEKRSHETLQTDGVPRELEDQVAINSHKAGQIPTQDRILTLLHKEPSSKQLLNMPILETEPELLVVATTSEQSPSTKMEEMDRALRKLEVQFASDGPKDVTESLSEEPTLLSLDATSEQSSTVCREKNDGAQRKLYSEPSPDGPKPDRNEVLSEQSQDLHLETYNAHLDKTDGAHFKLDAEASAEEPILDRNTALSEVSQELHLDAFNVSLDNTDASHSNRELDAKVFSEKRTDRNECVSGEQSQDLHLATYDAHLDDTDASHTKLDSEAFYDGPTPDRTNVLSGQLQEIHLETQNVQLDNSDGGLRKLEAEVSSDGTKVNTTEVHAALHAGTSTVPSIPGQTGRALHKLEVREPEDQVSTFRPTNDTTETPSGQWKVETVMACTDQSLNIQINEIVTAAVPVSPDRPKTDTTAALAEEPKALHVELPTEHSTNVNLEETDKLPRDPEVQIFTDDLKSEVTEIVEGPGGLKMKICPVKATEPMSEELQGEQIEVPSNQLLRGLLMGKSLETLKKLALQVSTEKPKDDTTNDLCEDSMRISFDASTQQSLCIQSEETSGALREGTVKVAQEEPEGSRTEGLAAKSEFVEHIQNQQMEALDEDANRMQQVAPTEAHTADYTISRLKEECLRNRLIVNLPMLDVNLAKKIKQPHVCVKRLSAEEILKHTTRSCRRFSTRQRRPTLKAACFFESGDSSDTYYVSDTHYAARHKPKTTKSIEFKQQATPRSRSLSSAKATMSKTQVTERSRSRMSSKKAKNQVTTRSRSRSPVRKRSRSGLAIATHKWRVSASDSSSQSFKVHESRRSRSRSSAKKAKSKIQVTERSRSRISSKKAKNQVTTTGYTSRSRSPVRTRSRSGSAITRRKWRTSASDSSSQSFKVHESRRNRSPSPAKTTKSKTQVTERSRSRICSKKAKNQATTTGYTSRSRSPVRTRSRSGSAIARRKWRISISDSSSESFKVHESGRSRNRSSAKKAKLKVTTRSRSRSSSTSSKSKSSETTRSRGRSTMKTRKRRSSVIVIDSSNTESSNSIENDQPARKRKKNLVVTPRSASGLKLRISSRTVNNAALTMPAEEFVIVNSPSAPLTQSVNMTNDPLYEEETILPHDPGEMSVNVSYLH